MEIIGLDPRPDKPLRCPQCGWVGYIGTCKIALWIDPNFRTPVASGGDGKNYRCPVCNLKLDQVRYPPMPKIKHAARR